VEEADRLGATTPRDTWSEDLGEQSEAREEIESEEAKAKGREEREDWSSRVEDTCWEGEREREEEETRGEGTEMEEEISSARESVALRPKTEVLRDRDSSTKWSEVPREAEQ
jgi:hypothetical protein